MTTDPPSLEEELLALFYAHDPVGLRAPGMSPDEYRPEVADIMAHLDAFHSAQGARWLIWGTVAAYFAPHEVGPEEDYQELAEQVWEAWCRHRTSRV